MTQLHTQPVLVTGATGRIGCLVVDQLPGAVVEMLLAAWGATTGRPAYVTSTVADILGSPARTFRQWTDDHAEAFR